MATRFTLVLLLILSGACLIHAQIDPRLLAAVRQNNPQAVMATLRTGANPNVTDAQGWTPIDWAAAEGHLESLSVLADNRADLTAGKSNAMMLAVEKDQANVIAFLLNRGVVLDKSHPRYSQLRIIYLGHLVPIARAFGKQGQYHQAALAYEQLRNIYGEAVSKQDKTYALLLSNLALSYKATGQYDKALPLYGEDLAITDKTLGKQHPDYATILNNLANLYQQMSQYEKALPLYEQGRQILEQVPGKQHPNYANALNNLALLHKAMGQYEKALPLYEQGRQILEQVLGKQHPDYATTLSNLASLYESMGQYEKALPLYEEDLAITEKAQGKQHPAYATTLNNLALLSKSMGQYEKALPLYEQGRQIQEQVLGKQHPDYATTLSNLADLYESMGQYEKALPLLLECLQIRRQVLGHQHHAYATTLNNLAHFYQQTGQSGQALPLLLEGRQIFERTLGRQHPNYATTLNNLAGLYRQMGQYEKGLPIIQEARQQYRSQLLSQIGMLNESAIRQFQAKFDQSDFVYSFGYAARSQALAGQHYTDALLSKGIGLLATQQLNALLSQTRDTTAQRLAGQLRHTRQQLNRQLNQPLASQQGVDSLQRVATTLEQYLVRQLPEYGRAFGALQVEWPQVQKALKPDEAAIEFVQFSYYNWRLRTVDVQPVWQPGWTDSTFYAAVVLRPGWPAPRLVMLTEGRALDTLVALRPGEDRRAGYVDRLYTAPDRGGVVSGTGSKPQPGLYALIWQPLDSLLRGARRVYYSPAGMLHRLNLAALPITSAQRVGEKYRLTLLPSTRQLALLPRPSQSNKRALLMGGITYERDPTAYRLANARFRLLQSRPDYVAVRASDGRGTAWNELKNTEPEVQVVGTLLARKGFRPDTLMGLQASEEALYALTQRPEGSPRVLHLATHGFFYEAPKSPTATGWAEGGSNAFAQSKEALLRSGLALAGANAFWRDGQTTPDTEDGILTANEVSLLRLHQTELVVLSACETGLGDLRGSEGVYGLQRAFRMAGVQTILMSLWQVPDKPTRLLVQAFYQTYGQPGQTVRSAFDQAVRQLREQYEEPYFWAGFVLVE